MLQFLSDAPTASRRRHCFSKQAQPSFASAECVDHYDAGSDASGGCHRSHAATLFGTTTACGRAVLAMLHLMLAALIAARLAHLGANLTERRSEPAAPCHERSSHAADVRAVHVERDTSRHHLHVVFLQAGRRTHVAGVGTGIAGIDTRLIPLWHDVLLEWVGNAISGLRWTGAGRSWPPCFVFRTRCVRRQRAAWSCSALPSTGHSPPCRRASCSK
jgi:hypothetical protein